MKRLAALGIGMLCLTSGCLTAGRLDPGVVARYQRAMAGRNPQQREATGMGAFRPAGRTVSGPLKVVKDDKTGRSAVSLTLDQAVLRTLVNNVDIAVVSFDPAVSREQAAQAAAAFDAVLFGTIGYQKTDLRSDASFFGTVSKVHTYQAGLKQRTLTGASASLTANMTRTWDNASFRVLQPRYEPTLTAELVQPLLRDAWPEFNLATLRIARMNEQMSAEAFRQKVEQTIAEVIGAYWSLVEAHRNLAIQESLLADTLQTLQRVRARGELDATAVQIKQAEAAVERRRAVLLRARKTIRDLQDHLGRLMSDPQVNVLGDVDIVPTTEPVVAKVTFDPTDQLLAALEHSPVLAQARLAIAVADVNVRVARNQTLPRLDLSLSGTLQGLGGTLHSAKEQLNSGDYAGYAAALTLEYPVGNRAAQAKLRQSRLERLKTLTQLQSSVDLVAQGVRERVREVETAHDEMLAQQATVQAARAQLQALEATEEIRGRLTPEFLSLKLAAQESLATAELAESQALTAYNTAMVDLARETGTVLELNRVKLALPAAIGEGAEEGEAPTPPKTQ